MASEPETEVTSCPSCNHLLRVPLDLLGQRVQCPECQAMLRAPRRDGTGGLTAPELLSRPATASPGAPRKLDAVLLLPAFGLMLCGVAGMIVNGVTFYRLMSEPAVVRDTVRLQVAELRKFGFGADDPEAERDRLDDARTTLLLGSLRWALPAMATAAALAFLGGLSIALRWNRRVAQLGCIAAALDLNVLCCLPGAVAGLWGLLMLASDEGRGHFLK